MKNRAISTICIALVSLLLFAACDGKVLYTKSQNVDVDGWNMDDHRYFDVEVADTQSIYTFYIDLRIANNYPYSNTFFFINTTFPDGGVAHDTLECPLADVDGRWYGKRTGRYIDNRYVFRKDLIFPTPGTYRFDIGHGMRDSNIVGIHDIGLHIAKSSARQ